MVEKHSSLLDINEDMLLLLLLFVFGKGIIVYLSQNIIQFYKKKHEMERAGFPQVEVVGERLNSVDMHHSIAEGVRL